MSEESSELYPSLSLAAAIALTAPVQTADVERLFSALKIVNMIENTVANMKSIISIKKITFSNSSLGEDTSAQQAEREALGCLLQGGH